MFGPESWAAFGPFSVQSSRVLHYLVYFLAGVAIGECGIGHSLLAPDGRLGDCRRAKTTQWTAAVRRVGVWRGGFRSSMSVCRPFRLAVP